ncbi:unnamed protein product, partial [Symbiodinium sp. CCMP2456]
MNVRGAFDCITMLWRSDLQKGSFHLSPEFFLLCLEIVAGDMSLVDSTAAFKQRCHDVDGSALQTALEAQGITSFASLAYACGTPQDRPTQAEMDAFATRILGAAPRLGDVALLKRLMMLMFEACTYVIAQLRQSVQGETSETPRKLPLAEKAARAEDQKRRLVGVHIERDMIPSHALVDLCCHMLDVGVTWISPGKCTSRESEIQLSTKDQSRVFRLEDNSLKADREAWLIMASEVKSLKVTAAGEFPLTLVLDALRTDPRITMYLMATWGRAPDVKPVDADHPPPVHNKPGEGLSRSAKRRRRLKAAAASRTTTPTGKAPSAARTMPAELKDAHQKAEALAEVERLAADCLRAGFVSFDSLMSMSALLPAVRRCGYLLPVHQGPQLLPSERLHATCDWRGTIIAFNFARLAFVYPATTVMLLHLLPLSSTTAATHHLRLIGPALLPIRWAQALRLGRGLLIACRSLSPLVLEVFAGTARLSSACQRLGFRTLAVDKASAQSRFPIQQLDRNDHMRQAEPEQHFLEQLHHEETVQVCGLLQSDDPCSTSAELIVVGIPREPQNFVNEAVKAGHPRNGLASSRSGPAADIVDAVLLSFEDREKRAEATRQRWSNIEATTRSLNDKILKGKPKYLTEALGNKNVLAWRDILRHNGFKDDQLWADLRDGFRLTGWMRDTGIFDKKLRPPETTLERLLEQSSYRTPLTLNKLRKTVVDDTTRKAWAETLEEEKKGWIFRDAMATDKPMVIAHRFGLEQKGKVRVIDNGKE